MEEFKFIWGFMGATRAFEPALSEVSFLALFTSPQVVQNMALELVLA